MYVYLFGEWEINSSTFKYLLLIITKLLFPARILPLRAYWARCHPTGMILESVLYGLDKSKVSSQSKFDIWLRSVLSLYKRQEGCSADCRYFREELLKKETERVKLSYHIMGQKETCLYYLLLNTVNVC